MGFNECHCEEFVGGCAKHRDEDSVYEQFVDLMCDTFDADEMAYAHVVQQQIIHDEQDGHA